MNYSLVKPIHKSQIFLYCIIEILLDLRYNVEFLTLNRNSLSFVMNSVLYFIKIDEKLNKIQYTEDKINYLTNKYENICREEYKFEIEEYLTIANKILNKDILNCKTKKFDFIDVYFKFIRHSLLFETYIVIEDKVLTICNPHNDNIKLVVQYTGDNLYKVEIRKDHLASDLYDTLYSTDFEYSEDAKDVLKLYEKLISSQIILIVSKLFNNYSKH